MLTELSLSHFRNYQKLEMGVGHWVTIITGPNGSGKTSLLEAVYFLGTGRSFRTSRLERLTTNGAQECVVHGVIRVGERNHRIGISRGRAGITGIRVDGENVGNTSVLAALFPVQAFHPETINLVEGSAGVRRKYLDWGLFHVEHRFLGYAKDLQAALRQRNGLLKSNAGTAREMQIWTRQVVDASVKIDDLRRAYLESLRPRLDALLEAFPWLPEVELALHGTSPDRDVLYQELMADLPRDQLTGHTSKGAQRTDLRIHSRQGPAREIFSRGQAKTLAYLLLLAQVQLFQEVHGGSRVCTLLVDDLPSELDAPSRTAVLDILLRLKQPVMITALKADQLAVEGLPKGLHDAQPDSVKMFHVEHGEIKPGQLLSLKA